MADRVPPYSMLPPNFNPALAQHPQLAQQGQHQGLVDQQAVAGMLNSEQARMWPQMQQFLAQQRVQGGGEGIGPMNQQMNQQMFDFMRSHNMARAQVQQGMNQHHQPVNMSQAQMNPIQPIRDLQSASQQMQPGFNANFPNAGAPNGLQFPTNLGQGQTSAALARNANVFAQMAANPNQMRQLDLLALAQNQQPQNGVAARLAQQQQQLQQMMQHSQSGAGVNLPQSHNQMGQPNFFNHPSITPAPDNRQSSSPHVPHQHPTQITQSPQPPQAQRPIQRYENTIRVLIANRNAIREEISAMTNELQRIRNTVFPKTADVQMQALNLEKQIHEKESKFQQFTKLMNEYELSMQKQAANGLGSNPALNSGAGSNIAGSPMPGQRPGHPMQNHPANWPGQQNLMPPSLSNGHIAQGSPSVTPQLPNQFPNAQVNSTQIGQQPGMPQQPGNPNVQRSMSAQGGRMGQAQPVNPTAALNALQQQQHPQMQKADGLSFNPQNTLQLLQQMPPELRAQVQAPIQALEPQKFRDTYMNFCQRKRINLDERLLKIDGRSIDLHALHSEVTKEGGFSSVTRKDVWAVIGARLGFVQFPATAQEPAKAGPGVAQTLTHVYQQYLKDFDDLYVQTIISSRLKIAKERLDKWSAAGGMQQPVRNTAVAPNLVGHGGQGPLTNRPSPQDLLKLVIYAGMSVQTMRENNISESVINLVDQNRTLLLQQARQQEGFRNQVLKHNQNGMPGNQMAMNMGQRVPSAGPGQIVNQGQNLGLGNNALGSMAQMPQLGQPSMPAHSNMDGMNGAPAQAASGPMNGMPPPISSYASRGPGPRKPTQEQIAQSIARVEEIKKTNHLANIRDTVVPLPEEQKHDYRNEFDRLCRVCEQLEPRMALVLAIWQQEDLVIKLITITQIKDMQKIHFASPNAKYMFPYDKLTQMTNFVVNAYDNVMKFISVFQNPDGIPRNAQGPVLGPNAIVPPPSVPAHVPTHGPIPGPVRTPVPASVSSAGSPSYPPMSRTPVPSGGVARPPPPPQGTPGKKRPPSSAASPSAAASSSTPGASAATPITITNSPQLGKSPKAKPTPKPKASTAPKRKPSIKASVDALVPVPEVAHKRKREDAPIPEPEISAPSPPKKAKTGWEEPPNPDIAKKQEQAENANTDEDALAFFHQMEDLMKQVGSNGVLPSECAETLDGILKGYDGDLAAGDASSSITLDPTALLTSSPDIAQRASTSNSAENFEAFFDFSSFAGGGLDEEVSVSKAPTPDLVVSSSANPSPESGADEPGGHGAGSGPQTTTPRIAEANVDDYISNPLRPGIFGEVDGGESLFYSSDSWKWEGLMPTSESAWAMSDS